MTTGRRWLLVLDTATSRVVVAAGSVEGSLIGELAFPAAQRHGERLLAAIEELTRSAELDVTNLRGVIVGTGPGAFTGLRVGLATAKTIAHELAIPIAGVSTGEALLAAGEATIVELPAGPQDRVEVRPGRTPQRLAGGSPTTTRPAEVVAAVDLEGRAGVEPAALERGGRALDGLAAALLGLGVARLAVGPDDPDTLVPEYVTLPRGIVGGLDPEAGVAWSRDHR